MVKSTARLKHELTGAQVAFDPYIDFSRGSTNDVAHGFFNFSKDQQFSILVAGTGHGKTAMGIHTAGLYAKAIGATADDPLHVVVIAPKAKIEEHGWDKTFEQYYDHGEYGDLIIHTNSYPYDTLSSWYKNDKTTKAEWEQKLKKRQQKHVDNVMKQVLTDRCDELTGGGTVINASDLNEMEQRAVDFLIKKNDLRISNELREKPTQTSVKLLSKKATHLYTVKLADPLYKGQLEQFEIDKDGLFRLLRAGVFGEDIERLALVDEKEMTWQELRDSRASFKKDFLQEFKDYKTILIIDEVHNMKNAKSNRGKWLKQVLPHTTVLGLTATPMSNGLIQDGVGYLVYNGFYSSHSACIKEHVSMYNLNRYYQPDVWFEDGTIDPNRFRGLPKFKEEINQTIFMPEIEADFEMPNQLTHSVSYTLSDRTMRKILDYTAHYQNREYEGSFMGYLTDVRQAIGKDTTHRLELMKCIDQPDVKQPLIFYQTNAELGLDVDEVIPRDTPDYEQELEAVAEDARGILYELAKHGIRYQLINGSHSMENVDVSDTDQAIVIQYRAGGAGIEFPHSNCSVFYGLSYSWQDIKQALGRNVRRGQTHTVNSTFLVSTTKFDEHVWDKINQKKEFTDEELKAFADELSDFYHSEQQQKNEKHKKRSRR